MNKINSIILFISLVLFTGCSKEETNKDNDSSEKKENIDNGNGESTDPETPEKTIDINKDGHLNILIIGTSNSIKSGNSEFNVSQTALELNNILENDSNTDLNILVEAEDIYKSKLVTFGLGQAGTTYNTNHYAHSLMQYYYWPENLDNRLNKLSNNGETKWDYIIIGSDPYILKKTPTYYALGAHKIVSKIKEGSAKPILLMEWEKDETSKEHFEEFTYRTADGINNDVEVIPAGIAWTNLENSKKDSSSTHPTENGAYLTAAAIYSHIFNKSASESEYEYNDDIANSTHESILDAKEANHYTGEITFNSPFASCNIKDQTLNYNHTGSSSENGILNGLNWVIDQTNKSLVNGGDSPINFNYGRANTNFEANKRYKIDSGLFNFSFGFPMQDNGNHGNTSMLYGLDKRVNETENGTDLGVALYMVRNNELPNARTIPIRTLYAQLKEAISTQSAYSDNWHMHGNLDKATASYMYTLLTGENINSNEPIDRSSIEWQEWKSNQIGHETANILMKVSK